MNGTIFFDRVDLEEMLIQRYRPQWTRSPMRLVQVSIHSAGGFIEFTDEPPTKQQVVDAVPPPSSHPWETPVEDLYNGLHPEPAVVDATACAGSPAVEPDHNFPAVEDDSCPF